MVEDLFHAARRGALSAGAATHSWTALPEAVGPAPVVWPARDLDDAPLARPSIVDRSPARTGWRGRIRRLTGGLIAPKPSGGEQKLRAAKAVAGSTLDRPLTVLVTCFGTAGDATLRIADTFGAVRGGSVVALTPAEPATVPELAARLPMIRRRGDLTRIMLPRPTGVDVLATGGRPVPALAGVLEVLRRFYPVVCLDDPAAVGLADVLVVCAAPSREATAEAKRMLSWLRAGGHTGLVDRAVLTVPPGPDWTFVCASIIDSFVAADINQEMTQGKVPTQ